MLGYVSEQEISEGTTVFSSDDEKGINYSDYAGSIVESYVNEYKTNLEELGAIISSATLITKEELEILGCSSGSDTCIGAPTFVYSTSYWSGSARNTSCVWSVNFGGGFDNYSNDIGNKFGVRPVITILSSEI